MAAAAAPKEEEVAVPVQRTFWKWVREGLPDNPWVRPRPGTPRHALYLGCTDYVACGRCCWADGRRLTAAS